MSRLPEGWIETSFMEVFDIQGGTQPPKAQFRYEPQEGYIRLLQIRDFGDRPVPTYIPSKSGLKTCNKEDVLIGRYGASVGRICTGMEGAYNVALAKVLTPKEIDRRFVFYLLQSDLFQKPILATERSAQDGFNKDDLERIRIPLIPLAEQRRIVAKLETLLGKVDACRQRLAKIPVILKRFRQAVLAAACWGELTTDWREKNPAQEIKSGSETKPDKTQETFDLPTTWKVTLFKQFIESSFYGPRFSAESYTDIGVPTIRTTDIGFDGSITLIDAPRLSVSAKELEKYGLQQDDLLVTRTGATIGKCALYDSAIGPAIPSAYLIRFRLHRELVFPQYGLTFLMSPVGQQLLLGGSTSVAQPNVNAATISDFPIPAPPYEEQREIVRRVKALFKLADQLEARYHKAKTQVDKLHQSILAKAFRGELVPTEAELARREGRDYEPASALLERIRSERAEHAQGRKEKAGSQMKPIKGKVSGVAISKS